MADINVARFICAPFRFYRSCGFGVHSPFAYRLMEDVIRGHSPGYGYYADKEIKQICRRYRVAPRIGRRFFRLLVYVNPAVTVVPEGKNLWGDIAALYSPLQGSAIVWVVDSPAGFTDNLREIIFGVRPCYLVVANLADREVGRCFSDLTSSVDYGMIFSNGRYALFCAVRGIPRQQYGVWI